MNRTDITSRLAQRLKQARTERALSLDAVAQLSGVSRSMVSQIERGTSSPTVATLWNLTNALGIDFAGLLDDSEKSSETIEFLKSADTPTIDSQGSGCRIRILSPPEAAGKHEVYDITFQSGAALESQPHSPGAREHLTVISGRLTVQSGTEERKLGPGDTARYPADQVHAIRTDAGPARAFLIVQYE
jgi:transcriptional regulator with XRE-family HTH domain